MKILLLHPEDQLLSEPWTQTRWDRVEDLGLSGSRAYQRAGAHFGIVPERIELLRAGEISQIRDLLGVGLNRLCDDFGLDWWELTSILVHRDLELAIALRRFCGTLDAKDEVVVSRPGFHASALAELLGATRVHSFPRAASEVRRGARHYARLLRKFPPAQLAQIFWDKTDPGYQLRGRFSASPKPAASPVVLVPTAYVNVTRTGLGYAQALPDCRFLLVATRPSGWLEKLPANVNAQWLRTYASLNSRGRAIELQELLERWEGLRTDLEKIPDFRVLLRVGLLDDFPVRFARGLEVRDAWRNVLDREPVQAVLCADDSNPYTHIPLLLARHRGIATVVCHHGALDGRYRFKRPRADKILAKGNMEEDYLVRQCQIAPELVEIGAPGPSSEAAPAGRRTSAGHPNIVFFSEAYEVGGGRARDFYEDVLPPLARLALAHERKLQIKLHPAESVFERTRMIGELLSPEEQRVTSVVEDVQAHHLIAQSWFAVTVLSTVAVQLSLQGVPCFLCKWLEAWPYGYVDQFTRFGVGIPLMAPNEIEQIPRLVMEHRPNPKVRTDCWTPIQPSRLRELLGGMRVDAVRRSTQPAQVVPFND
jgi:hypothetical protein